MWGTYKRTIILENYPHGRHSELNSGDRLIFSLIMVYYHCITCKITV